MQYKALAFAAALAAGVSAQSTIPESVSASVVSVLMTALPPSELSRAASNQMAFQSEIASSLSAGTTPDWYQALPEDVKTILYPASAPAETTADVTSPATTMVETGTGAVSGKPTGGNNSTSTVNPPTLSTTGGTGAPTDNGASYPTAVIGSGLAGALGVIGILAL